MRQSLPSSAQELQVYLELLAERARAGQLLNLRWLGAEGRARQAFYPAGELGPLAERIIALATSFDVFLGVALRDSRHGGRAAISAGHLLHLDCDGDRARQALAGFRYPPTLEVASGTPGHLHCYWLLSRRAAPDALQSANRRLAHALGGDPACVGVAHVMRPPQSFNHKTTPSRPVSVLAHRRDARYALAEILEQLPLDPRPCVATRRARRRSASTQLEARLLAIPAPEYVRLLAGREPNRVGKVLCPFHEERDPSLQLYPDGTFYCFGRHDERRPCAKGGTIFDFAAAMWGLGTRGHDFLELRARLSAVFSIGEP